ncbi:MAG: prepilin-type N-terminal cleavage/methylation domain-containing protein [SAR324 cluster bacterium]|nr:prepilin-type N-terminal cleavage/methylation domain-containing protein [SAR324 cluster bacterium]MBL7035602.1 prepilin-type N-terminal cleavage/methylation domain-containing protein [SAR324 cluster bacterium]
MVNGYIFCINREVSGLKRGFSLLEVMIVVVIIGILATLAYPSLDGYLLRSKQTEAKVSLSAVYTAQKIYFATNQTYADTLSKLDVQLESGGSALYTITLAANSTSFTATAKGNLDDDAVLDIWTIDQNKSLQNTVNDSTSE